MRLAEFITLNLESILDAWEDFARTVQIPSPPLDQQQLRNHAEQLLRTVASGMQVPQNAPQQFIKSRGHKDTTSEDVVAQQHALNRLDEGFTLDQVVSEYRALRSSVIRLWLSGNYGGETHEIDDLVRFNEAIDQALTASITSYELAIEVARKRMLGILGHDLRTPLGAALMGAQLLRQKEALSDRGRRIANQVIVSTERAHLLVSDLLDLARSVQGSGIPVRKAKTDLNELCTSLTEELQTCHPHTLIEYKSNGTVIARVDPMRIAQIITNLVSNAIQHGVSQQPVTMQLVSTSTDAIVTVHNHGEPIPKDVLKDIFRPMVRGSSCASAEQSLGQGLGLGLYIASEIATGHGGHIDVESTLFHGTTFRVSLPLG